MQEQPDPTTRIQHTVVELADEFEGFYGRETIQRCADEAIAVRGRPRTGVRPAFRSQVDEGASQDAGARGG